MDSIRVRDSGIPSLYNQGKHTASLNRIMPSSRRPRGAEGVVDALAYVANEPVNVFDAREVVELLIIRSELPRLSPLGSCCRGV